MAFKINAPFKAVGNPNSIESNKEPEITAGIGTKKRVEQYKDANYAPDHTTHRKKAKTVASSSKGADIKVTKVKAEKPKVSSAKPTKKVEPTKKQARKTKSINKKLDKAKAARDAGNIKKAERKERAAKRKADRVARKSKK